MNTANSVVFKDEEASLRILAILNDATSYAVFVTPYIKLWGHAKNAIELATKKGVDVVFLVRGDDEVVHSPDVRWLRNHNVDVRFIDRLHAKIYLNETTTVVTSMNLHESSSKNSLEIGTDVVDADAAQDIREYVDSTLMKLAQPQKGQKKLISTTRRSKVLASWDAAFEKDKKKKPATARKSTTDKKAHCIRCEKTIAFDPTKPLCDVCYESWAQYENGEYPESVCHRCGKEKETSYDKPLCYSCYKATVEGTNQNKETSPKRSRRAKKKPFLFR